jgi:hypothetical protein
MEATSIKPKQYNTSVFVINADMADKVSIININVNYNNNKTIILDKIEYSSTSLSTEQICTPSSTQDDILDADLDGITDSLDAFPLDPTEWIDTDSDLLGNNTDLDDDNDGIIDEDDIRPLDSSIGDDEPPIFAPLEDIIVTYNADETCVTIPTPVVNDNNLHPVTVSSDLTYPITLGSHEVAWTAIDYAGNTTSANQIINVIASNNKDTVQESIETSSNGGTIYELLLFIILIKLHYKLTFQKITRPLYVN